MIRRIAFSLFAVFALALAAPSARAFGLSDIGDIVDGIIPDPCDLVPDLCGGGDPPPPPDPCEQNPLLCNPHPNLCEVVPELCNGEPPVLDPGDPPAPTFPHSADLAGVAKVRGDGFRSEVPLTLALNFDDSTFLATDGTNVYTGHLSPKGKRGTKFQLFLDGGSADAFSAAVGGLAADATGRAAGSILGQSSKLVLSLRDDGSASLKLKAHVLASGLGEVVLKANLRGPVTDGN